MRERGTIEAPVGLGPGDHVCWVIEDDADLVDTITAWINDGVARDERVLYLVDVHAAQLMVELPGVPDLAMLVARGQLVLGAPDLYGGDGLDELALVTFFASAIAEALMDGYTGMRVAALHVDMEDQAAIDAFVAWEQLADTFFARSRASALCMLDRRSVTDAAITSIGAAHPACRGFACTTPFRLHVHEDGWRLAGELETFDRFRLEQMLRNTADETDRVVLHLGDLDHASGGCTSVLHDFARRQAAGGGRLVLKEAPPRFRDGWRSLGFDAEVAVFA